jgi:5-methylcytosine-specific restriction endonuclease McrA
MNYDREKRKAYYEASKERITAYNRKWRKEKARKDPKYSDLQNRRVKEYQKTPHGQAAWKAGLINTAANRRGQRGKVSKDDILLLWNNYRCAACGAEDQPVEIDHIIPAMYRGHNIGSNLQLLCVPCHKEKTRIELRANVRETVEDLDQLSLFN